MSEEEKGLDHFLGEERALALSLRLMDWYQEPVSDEEVAEVLGEGVVAAFRYAQRLLEGKVRRVTLEPAFCHSADIAFRAQSLGYPRDVLISCLLHDILEDTCGHFSDVPEAASQLRRQFGGEIGATVLALTNRYQMIFKAAAKKVSHRLPFEPRSRNAFGAAIRLVRQEQPWRTGESFADEFNRLETFMESEADLVQGARIAMRDKKFTLATHLERQVYSLYIEELVNHAVAACANPDSADRTTVAAMAIKLLDLTDNIRTSEISNRLALFKLVAKAESVLDRLRSIFLTEVEPQCAQKTTIPTLTRLVELRLVDQIEARRDAVAQHFAETRFAGLIDFLAEHVVRLKDKYQVGDERHEEIKRLENEIRQINHEMHQG